MPRTQAYKVFTHDLRPPVRGGDPVWAGGVPHMLPRTEVDTSDEECAAGWNACAMAEDALRIAGLWPDGRPSRLFRVETNEPVFVRGDKVRAATWTIVEESAVDDAVHALSRKWFSAEFADEMALEQLTWRAALTRPARDPALVEQHLARALEARGLPWTLRRFDTARDAWDAWAAWAARAARDARDAWAARAARDARDAWDAWDAWAAWAAWDAWDALTHYFASAKKWVSGPRAQYTIGIRDAYAHGLAIAIPTAHNQIGWALDNRTDHR